MIQQIFIHGDSSKDFLISVIVPDLDFVKKWAKEKGLNSDDVETLLSDNSLKTVFIEAMASKATEFKLSGIERVKKVHLTST